MKMNAPKTAAVNQKQRRKKVIINDNDGNKTTHNTQNSGQNFREDHGLLF